MATTSTTVTSKAESDGDGDGDGGKNNKALKEKIYAKKRFVDSLPDWGDITTRKGLYERVGHIKELAEMECEYELLIESERIASAVREHEELHPPYTMECPICLEDIPFRSSKSMVMFFCCGKGTCRKCYEVEGGRLNNTCPLCRAVFPRSDEEKENLTNRCAENGRSWALYQAGNNYMFGTDGYPLNKKKAFHLLTLAAEQSYPFAMHTLAQIYELGDGVEQSNSKAQKFMTKAANLGFAPAQLKLSKWYYNGEAGFSVNHSKSLYYLTLVCSDERNLEAEYILGLHHVHGYGGLKKSLHLAKHYFERSAEGGYELAYHDYGLVLLDILRTRFNGANLPGYCAVPQALYWLRKAVANGDSDAAIPVEAIEKLAKQNCSYCGKQASSNNETLKCCAKCKAVWYCGRDCQVKAWKKGHKFDCIKRE